MFTLNIIISLFYYSNIIIRDLGFPRQENANSAASFCIFRDFMRKIRGKKYGIPRQIN